MTSYINDVERMIAESIEADDMLNDIIRAAELREIAENSKRERKAWVNNNIVFYDATASRSVVVIREDTETVQRVKRLNALFRVKGVQVSESITSVFRVLEEVRTFTGNGYERVRKPLYTVALYSENGVNKAVFLSHGTLVAKDTSQARYADIYTHTKDFENILKKALHMARGLGKYNERQFYFMPSRLTKSKHVVIAEIQREVENSVNIEL